MTTNSTAKTLGQPQTKNDGTQNSLRTKDMKAILASSFIGSMIEFYDFMLYATASSIVFAHLYFADLGPGLSLFASFTTLAVGYLTRPLGGIIFGHFGDRIGRKSALVTTMTIMGAVTVIIGLMPPTAQIGIIAPISLLLLRIVQGIAVGGEWGGAALMAIEHAPANKRVFAASFANAGAPAGAVLATLTMSLMTVLTGDDFVVWGWRIPFLISGVLIAIGLYIRLKVAETPAFQKMDEEAHKKKTPLAEVIQNYKKPVMVSLVAAITVYTTQAITTVWGVSVAVEAGNDRTTVLNWKAVAAIITVFVTFGAARLADHIGRRRMLISACIVAAVAALPLAQLIGSGDMGKYALAIILGNGIVQGLVYGPIAAYVAELFPPSVRYTGASLGYQLASAIGAGVTPMIATALVHWSPSGGLWALGAIWGGIALMGAITVALYKMPEDVHTGAIDEIRAAKKVAGQQPEAMQA
ncbi:MFS transporter [Pseudoglutamicibacter cumminsii]|uniref:MFS transporter n=1 Tax=Pseudoglutamicibacter cumminsii TaxID=156979 RepID=UPI00195EA922|nr:MFS transporter [Pseudoglutamicibacter cumminsii]MBM7795650.1 MFS family permease [Pseudoglutamicibacter cumminsii]